MVNRCNRQADLLKLSLDWERAGGTLALRKHLASSSPRFGKVLKGTLEEEIVPSLATLDFKKLEADNSSPRFDVLLLLLYEALNC